MDHMNTIKQEWHTLKEKWFHGETIDPVFEGVVRDFCTFDDTMHSIQAKVGLFMRGVEQLGAGLTALAEGVSSGLAHAADPRIASDSCKLKEAANQIARADAPHSAIAKLRRDMQFNILTPVMNHIANNRNLKVSLDIRRRRLVELTSAKKQFEDCQKRNLPHTDRRFLQAQSNFEAAKMTFTDVDRHVFEWLYILEEYRGDILDSTLQTLKYLQYEFFATSAHAISVSLPSRMEFRPMVEMTPDHLEAQVEMELAESEEQGEPEGSIADFSVRLIEKKAKEDPGETQASVPVDPLSLSSLLSQGFEEGPARRALRLHQNNTQAALDWLIDGGEELARKAKAAEDGVRMPTTVKRVQKLKAMRKAQQEKLKRSREREEEGRSRVTKTVEVEDEDDDEEEEEEEEEEPPPQVEKPRPAPAPQVDLLAFNESSQPASAAPPAASDLLSLDSEEPAKPTDFSKPLEFTSLPDNGFYDSSRCEKPPLAASVAAGIAVPRGQERQSEGAALDPLGMMAPAQAAPAGPAPAGGLAPELLAAVQALSAQSGVTPQQLIQAAQNLGQGPSSAPALAAPMPTSTGGYPAAPAAKSGFQALDPFSSISATPPATATAAPMAPLPGQLTSSGQAAPTGASDQFGGLVNLISPGTAPSSSP